MGKEDNKYMSYSEAQGILGGIDNRANTAAKKIHVNNPRKRTKANPEAEQKRLDYFASLKTPKKKFQYTLPTLLTAVANVYRQKNGEDLHVENPKVRQFVYLLACYFLRISMKGIETKNGYIDFDIYSDVSKLSFDKGLCFYGNFGAGKTSIMKAFAACFYGTDLYFRVESIKDLVNKFGWCKTSEDESYFFNSAYEGVLMIDEINREKLAVNYSKKIELTEELLDGRERRKKRTHMAINAGSISEVEGILGGRYGGAIVSRSYKMFNFVHADWQDYRK